MNRRQFATATATVAIIAGSIARTHAARGTNVPPVEFDAEDYAAVRFIANAEDPIRSVSVRVSAWADEADAERHRGQVVARAGSDLPLGEFYQSEPVRSVLPPELSTLPATAMTWNTTVGVAAYRTEWVLLSARRETVVWDLGISGGEPAPVLDLAVALAIDLTARDVVTGNDFARLLPDPGQLPDGMTLEYRMTPDGTVDAQGTPIPEASPER